jgi:hypothetical protein
MMEISVIRRRWLVKDIMRNQLNVRVIIMGLKEVLCVYVYIRDDIIIIIIIFIFFSFSFIFFSFFLLFSFSFFCYYYCYIFFYNYVFLGCFYDAVGFEFEEDEGIEHRCYDLKDDCILYIEEHSCEIAPQGINFVCMCICMCGWDNFN